MKGWNCKDQGFLNNLLREAGRQRAIVRDVGMAYSALRPCLEKFASESGEWQDSQVFFVEEKKGTEKNRFVVDGDNQATYRKALGFLLEQKGNDIYNIASVLLGDKCAEKKYDQSMQKVVGLLSEILGSDTQK